MKKQGIAPGILVSTIAAVAVLTVILIFLTPKITDILTGAGEQAQCQFSLLVSKTAETVTFGFGKEVPVECKTTRKTITQNDLARYTELASQAISSFPSNSEAAKTFTNDQQGKDKWALAKIIADDMKSCYDRGWRGQLKIGELAGVKKIGEIFGPGDSNYLCILCTRYSFDSDVYPLGQISIKSWLENSVVDQKTFYDYLTNDRKDVFATQTIGFSDVATIEPLAVLFVANKEGYGGVTAVRYSSITSNIRSTHSISQGKTILLPLQNALEKSNFDETSTKAIIFSPDFKGKASETGLVYIAKNGEGFFASSISKFKAEHVNKEASDEIKKYVADASKLAQEKGITEKIKISLPYYTVKYKTDQEQIIVYLYNDKGESYFYFEPYIDQYELVPLSTNCATIIGD